MIQTRITKCVFKKLADRDKTKQKYHILGEGKECYNCSGYEKRCPDYTMLKDFIKIQTPQQSYKGRER